MAAPHITTPSPAPSTAINRAQVIYVEVYENGGTLLHTALSVHFAGMGIEEVAFDGTDFTEPYKGRSFRVPVTDMTYGNGYGYTLLRDPFWPDGPRLLVRAFNTVGESATTTGTWSLTDPIAPPEPSIIPVFPSVPGPGPDGSDAPVNDAAYYLRVFDHMLPEWYLYPLKNTPNSGYELFRAAAQVGARMSQAIYNFETLNLSMFSAGGSYATGTVEFTRPNADAGAVILAAGTIVQCSKSGRGFITTEDAEFGLTDLGPVAVAVRSLFKSFQYNVPGKYITPVSNIELPGEIDTIRSAIQRDPTTGDRTFIEAGFSVENINPTTGGRPPVLDQIGADRGIIRGVGEPDEKYRYRVRTLPDTVSPGAFRRFLDSVFDLYGLTYDFVETFEKDYQTAYDYPSPNVGTPTYLSDPLSARLALWKDLFVFDWPTTPAVPISNRWLDDVEMRGTVIIGVPNLPAQSDVGMAYDDTAMDEADRSVTTGQITGRRSISAYDVPSTLDSALGLQGGYDGFDLPKRQFYLTLLENLNAIKAAGVTVLLELRGE